MSSNGVGGGAVDLLQGVDWSGLSDAEVLDAPSWVEVLHRRLPSVDHALVVELEVRSVAAKHLLRSTAHLRRSGCT